jgi:hypothetical protein
MSTYEGYKPSVSNVNTKEAARAQYRAAVMGDKKICLPTSHDEFEFRRAPDQGICELCGEQVVTTAAFHFDAQGDICIRDPKRTLLAGKISRARYEEIVAERSVQPEKTRQ